ncbi:nuclear receptor coactivator 7 [Pelomyxa schiedti]|nr:nuclear receptor coactivator 7 [Pelomyxa schiedti]
MYERCQGMAPLVLIIKSADHNVFGAFFADPLCVRISCFYGTGETFLFTVSPIPVKYNWTHSNRYLLYTEQEQLACGGGGSVGYGLMIDDELHFGTTTRCATFENEPLNGGKEEFECVDIELIAICS